jgi:hypothetical protein
MAPLNQSLATTLRQVVRSIDKKAEYTASLVEGERAGVRLDIALRKHSTSVTVPLEEIEAAQEDLARRNRVRHTIKQALDRLGFQAIPVNNTKMMRAKVEAGGFFRPAQGGPGNRGRR